MKKNKKISPKKKNLSNAKSKSKKIEPSASKSLNKTLHQGKKAKNDEFYTQMADIEKELKHYKKEFRNKVVYCNCDDPFESNFFKYFAANFNALKLKKLITTSFVKSTIAGGQLSLFDIVGLEPKGKEPFKIEINEVKDLDSDGAIGLKDVELLLRHDANVTKALKGNGDFRSDECVELLKEADIIVTNPPFSLFREYVAQLEKYEKKYLIIGNTNAVKYNEIFKLVKADKIRTGYTNFNVGMMFTVPDFWEKFHHRNDDGQKVVRVSTACWFTNLDVARHHEHITLYKKYTSKEYPEYDNYDAINVNKYPDIPMNYSGTMGVPITFLDKYNPAQFEIIGIFDDKREKSDAFIQGTPTYVDEQHKKYVGPVIDGKALYTRLLIKNKKVKK